jgi:hypothetical protein
MTKWFGVRFIMVLLQWIPVENKNGFTYSWDEIGSFLPPFLSRASV